MLTNVIKNTKENSKVVNSQINNQISLAIKYPFHDLVILVTCQICGLHLAKACKCFDGKEWHKEWSRLANNESRIIKLVRKDQKKLFIKAEFSDVKKQAKLSKLQHFGISAEEKFTGREVGKFPFFMRLEEENGDLVYRRRFDDNLEDNDSITIQWILQAKSTFDRVGVSLLGKIFKGRGKPKDNPQYLLVSNTL